MWRKFCHRTAAVGMALCLLNGYAPAWAAAAFSSKPLSRGPASDALAEQAVVSHLVGASFFPEWDRGGPSAWLRRLSELWDGKTKPFESALPEIVISVSDMIALKVRMKPIGAEKPEYLYQAIPDHSLLAAIPTGIASLSFPNDSFPMTRDRPDQPTVIVYALGGKFHNTYFARQVIERGKVWDVKSFIDRVHRRSSKRSLSSAEETEFLYGAPSWQQWGTLLGSGGYAVMRQSGDRLEALGIDGTHHPSSSDPTAGLLIRFPRLQIKPGPTRYYFAQPQILIVDENGAERWLSFSDYSEHEKRYQEFPKALQSSLVRWIRYFPVEEGAVAWVFSNGMDFGAENEWWNLRHRRKTDHEGVDFYRYRDASGQTHSIKPGTSVFTVSEGEIVRVFDDVMAKSILVRHRDLHRTVDGVPFTFYSLYAHVKPRLWVGAHVHPEGPALATVAPQPVPGKGAPAHLHLSLIWIPNSVATDTIDWDKINPSYAGMYLVNPLAPFTLEPEPNDDAMVLSVPKLPAVFDPAQEGEILWRKMSLHLLRAEPRIVLDLLTNGLRLYVDRLVLIWPTASRPDLWIIVQAAAVALADSGISPSVSYYALSDMQRKSVMAYILQRTDRFMFHFKFPSVGAHSRTRLLTGEFWKLLYAEPTGLHHEFDAVTHPYIIEQAMTVFEAWMAQGKREFRVLQDGANTGQLLKDLRDHLVHTFPQASFRFLGIDLNADLLHSETNEENLEIRKGRAEDDMILEEGPFDFIIDDGLLAKEPILKMEDAQHILNLWENSLKVGGLIFSIPFNRYSHNGGSWLPDLRFPATLEILSWSIPEHAFLGRLPKDFIMIGKRTGEAAKNGFHAAGLEPPSIPNLIRRFIDGNPSPLNGQFAQHAA